MIQIPLFYGMGEKDRILAAISENHAIYLNALRAFAREAALRHPLHEVTIDDVRDMLDAHDYPKPEDIGIGARVFGPLFRTKDFEFVRWQRTRREEWAKRVGNARADVGVYRLVTQ